MLRKGVCLSVCLSSSSSSYSPPVWCLEATASDNVGGIMARSCVFVYVEKKKEGKEGERTSKRMKIHQVPAGEKPFPSG